MAVKKMPDWMMDYAAAIGEKSYSEYRLLKNKYYAEIDNYNHRIAPTQFGNLNMRSPSPIPSGWLIPNKKSLSVDPRPFMVRLEEKYKKEALEIACKYGYKQPPDHVVTAYDKLSKMQENSKDFTNYIKHDTNKAELSREDIIAKSAHQQYFKDHPSAQKDFLKTKDELRRLEYEEQHPDPYNHPYRSEFDEKNLSKSEMDKKISSFLSASKSKDHSIHIERVNRKDKDDRDLDKDDW